MIRTFFLKCIVIAFLCLLPSFFALADTLHLKNGGQIEGILLSFQKDVFKIKIMNGTVQEIKRDEVTRIEIANLETELPAKKLNVAVRNILADDYLSIFVNSQIVIEKARFTGEWQDVTPLLREGANELKVIVQNDGATWAYRWALRINGKVFIQQCGEPNRPMAFCKNFGLTGKETGIISGIPPLWLYVNSHKGTCELVKENE